jgi:phospholipase C
VLKRFRRARLALTGVAVLAGTGVAVVANLAGGGTGVVAAAMAHADKVFEVTENATTTTPIKHVVVIFDENHSYDNYFGTYPNATNTDGEPFYASPGTPDVQKTAGLTTTLLHTNPNASNPKRLTPDNITTVLTCDNTHDYKPEQYAFDAGKMNRFETSDGTAATATTTSPEGKPCSPATVMDYYDGNTATALWNYANAYAMSDNYFDTEFGPSTVGALDVTSGDTGGVTVDHVNKTALTPTKGYVAPDGNGGYSVIGDVQPYWDDCSTSSSLALTGENIGDLLNNKDLSWGWFQGGFTPATPYTGPVSTASTYSQKNDPDRVACTSSNPVGKALGGTGTTGKKAYGTEANYSAHYDGFAFYASTANPHHLAPASLNVVGTDTATPGEFNTANHNYTVNTFNDLVTAIEHGQLPATHLPAVSYLKAPVYETGHPASSDPITEQSWIVTEVNKIESLPTWDSTAIFITYDDSDGWYDSAFSGVSNPSKGPDDVLTTPTRDSTGTCGTETATTTLLYNEQGRCGYGARLPLVVISPYANQDYVSNTLTSQASILQFIEQNWNLGQIPGSYANVTGSLDGLFDFAKAPSQLDPPLILNPSTGEPSYPVEGTISPSHGSANSHTTVTIDGMNFGIGSNQTSISVGGVPATDVKCAASTTLNAPAATCTAVLPPGTPGESVPITVRVGRTTAVDDAGNYTYT